MGCLGLGLGLGLWVRVRAASRRWFGDGRGRPQRIPPIWLLLEAGLTGSDHDQRRDHAKTDRKNSGNMTALWWCSECETRNAVMFTAKRIAKTLGPELCEHDRAVVVTRVAAR